MSTGRCWIFTFNNPDKPIVWPSTVRYAIYQREIGENQTPHYQGYVEFSTSHRLSGVRKILPSAHWELRRGTRDQARAYASKEATRVEGPFEHGTFITGGRGTRNDIADLKESIRTGKTEIEIFEKHTLEYLKYNRSINAARALYAVPRSQPPVVTVIVGPTGAGKTKHVATVEPELYWKQQSKWWDGYDGQEAVIFDDFKGWIPFIEMLRVLDRYPLLIEIKGGQRHFTASRIYITSNYHPAKWWKSKPYLPALYRRITKLLWMDEDGELSTTDPDELFTLVAPLEESVTTYNDELPIIE